LFAPVDMPSIAIGVRVCLSVCLSVYVCPRAYLKKPHVQISRNYNM